MSVHLTSQENVVAMMDSVTGYAFGPTFESEVEAEAFLQYVQNHGGRDARSITPGALGALYSDFVKEIEIEQSPREHDLWERAAEDYKFQREGEIMQEQQRAEE